MYRIAIYIVGQLFAWLCLTLTGLALLFIVTQVIRVAPIFTGAGATGLNLLYLLSLVLVPIMAWSLTPSFAVAIFATASRMGAEGELVAAEASGVGRPTLFLGPGILALLLTFGSAWLWLAGAPSAGRLLQHNVSQLAGSALVGQLKAGVFQEPVSGIVFWADKRLGGEKFLGIFLEDRRNEIQDFHYVAKNLSIEYRPATQLVSITLAEGTAFSIPKVGDIPPVAISFDKLSLTIDVAGELRKRLDFLPATLSYTTKRLLEPPPPGTAMKDWQFALWRRIAGPVGFFLFSLLSIVIAFSLSSNRIGTAVVRGAVLFLLYHLIARWGETMMDNNGLSAKIAAILPSLLTSALLVVALGRFLVARALTRRLSRRMGSSTKVCRRNP